MRYRFFMDLLNNPDLYWSHFTGTPRFGYPIDYWGAILHVGDDGHIDFAYRWAPNSYCHFHRHLCSTTSTVIAGELHVTDFDDDGNVKVNLQVSTEDIVNGNKFSVNHRHADGGIP